MTITRTLLVRCSIALGLSACSFGAAISTTGANAGTTLNVIGITGFVTDGADMDGLNVTAVFSGGGSQSCQFADTGATSGGCSVSSFFSLNQSGDTYNPSENWTLINLSTGNWITSLILNGNPGGSSNHGVVFDRTFGGAVGTPDSAHGRDLNGTAPGLVTGSAVYSNFVAVPPAGPVQDIYTTVTVTFSGDGLAPGSTTTFNADTDTIGLGSGPPQEVPEPGTLTLIAMGAAFLTLGRRFKGSAKIDQE